MDNPATTGYADLLTTLPADAPIADSPAAAVLSGLLAVADRVLGLAADLLPMRTETAEQLFLDPTEPAHTGLYRDRDGDIWQKTDRGWRLCLQRGIAVDPASTWEWESGHVRDYGPFVPLAAN